MSGQLQYFQEYQNKLSALVGRSQAQKRVNQALVLITLGGNDFVNNYYLVPYSLRSRQFALPDYVRYLISEYKKILAVRTNPVNSSVLNFCHFSYISNSSTYTKIYDAFLIRGYMIWELVGFW